MSTQDVALFLSGLGLGLAIAAVCISVVNSIAGHHSRTMKNSGVPPRFFEPAPTEPMPGATTEESEDALKQALLDRADEFELFVEDPPKKEGLAKSR